MAFDGTGAVDARAAYDHCDSEGIGAYGSGHRVQTGGVDCHPCWKTTCARVDRACLTWVKPETVLTSCAHSLERRK